MSQRCTTTDPDGLTWREIRRVVHENLGRLPERHRAALLLCYLQGKQQLLDKYAPHLCPGRDYRPIQPEELAVTSVYRIAIDEWSGKQKVAPADHPGALLYGQPPAAAASPRVA